MLTMARLELASRKPDDARRKTGFAGFGAMTSGVRVLSRLQLPPELLARFRAGLDASAINLIRREWGFMLTHGPQLTMWEDIGPWGGGPKNADPSFDHGWSSGAAPVLIRVLPSGTLEVGADPYGFRSDRAW